MCKLKLTGSFKTSVCKPRFVKGVSLSFPRVPKPLFASKFHEKQGDMLQTQLFPSVVENKILPKKENVKKVINPSKLQPPTESEP